MALDVIGPGFGRTGTTSLRAALDILGFGPCYHMFEVVENPLHVKTWNRAYYGEPVDWRAFFSSYRATLDWPACFFWKDHLKAFPQAKVLLSIRDPEAWYQSVRNTIYKVMTDEKRLLHPTSDNFVAMANQIVLQDTFDGRFEDEDYAISVYERHNRQVMDEVPAGQLLVYRVSEGWEPLCAFLEVAVPESEFPRKNTSSKFNYLSRES